MIQTTTRNAELSDLVTLLRDQKGRQLDVVASAAALTADGANLRIAGTEPVLTEDGVTQGDGTYRPTRVADDGIADKLGIPGSYLRRLRDERPDLYDANVNGWLQGLRPKGRIVGGEWVETRAGVPGDSRKFLARCFRDDDGGIGVLRALLSDSYRPIDNLDVLLSALDGVREAGAEVNIEGADLTERRMVVRVTSPSVTALAPTLLRGYRSPFTGESGTDNPVVWAGFQISNSEVGGGAFSIVPRMSVRVCKNGRTITKDAMREVHLGGKLSEGVIRWSDATVAKNLELVRAQAADAVRWFLDVDYMRSTIERLEARADERVETPAQVEQVVRAAGYNKTVADEILAHFVQGGQTNRAGVVNALTSYAQTVEDGDRASDLEALAVTARIVAAGEQPTTQLAVELVRAEAALARVRAVLEHWGVPAGPEVGFAEDFAESIHESGAWRLARDLRAALDGSSGA
jgi:hypothetical protein